MSYEAARWAIDRINSQNYVNGVNFGKLCWLFCCGEF